MQLRMEKDSVLSTQCYELVASIYCQEVDSITVEDTSNETESLASEDTERDEAPAPMVHSEPVDEHEQADVSSDDVGYAATESGSGAVETVPEAQDTHDTVGEVLQSDPVDSEDDTIPLINWEYA